MSQILEKGKSSIKGSGRRKLRQCFVRVQVLNFEYVSVIVLVDFLEICQQRGASRKYYMYVCVCVCMHTTVFH